MAKIIQNKITSYPFAASQSLYNKLAKNRRSICNFECVPVSRLSVQACEAKLLWSITRSTAVVTPSMEEGESISENILVSIKPAIHYLQTWRIGDEIIFSPRQFFFDEKILCVCRRDCYPDANPAYSVWRKTCSQNMAHTFYTLFAVCRFFVVSPLFRSCSRIVYSGLKETHIEFKATPVFGNPFQLD